MTDLNKMNAQELEQVTGGNDGYIQASWRWVTVTGTKNYLAIRNEAAYDSSNEIGALHNGDRIQIRDDLRNGAYVWAYASQLNLEGWVNGNYVR
ncbi:MAG: hypothetical protein IJI10_10405 [Eubacterium sp.]|nr:hypothetical protein [Eubacterium sp.]